MSTNSILVLTKIQKRLRNMPYDYNYQAIVLYFLWLKHNSMVDTRGVSRVKLDQQLFYYDIHDSTSPMKSSYKLTDISHYDVKTKIYNIINGTDTKSKILYKDIQQILVNLSDELFKDFVISLNNNNKSMSSSIIKFMCTFIKSSSRNALYENIKRFLIFLKNYKHGGNITEIFLVIDSIAMYYLKRFHDEKFNCP